MQCFMAGAMGRWPVLAVIVATATSMNCVVGMTPCHGSSCRSTPVVKARETAAMLVATGKASCRPGLAL
jgi:hypothetical protein